MFVYFFFVSGFGYFLILFKYSNNQLSILFQPHRSGWPGGRNDLWIARADRLISLDIPGWDRNSSLGPLDGSIGIFFCCLGISGSKSEEESGSEWCRWFRLSCSRVFQRVKRDRVRLGTLKVSTIVSTWSFIPENRWIKFFIIHSMYKFFQLWNLSLEKVKLKSFFVRISY